MAYFRVNKKGSGTPTKLTTWSFNGSQAVTYAFTQSYSSAILFWTDARQNAAPTMPTITATNCTATNIWGVAGSDMQVCTYSAAWIITQISSTSTIKIQENNGWINKGILIGIE